MKKALVAVLGVAIAGVLLWPLAFTVVSIEDDSSQSGAFDPVAYVDGVWDQINTTVIENAVELAEVLAAIEPNEDLRISKNDLIPVTERFGLITVGEAHTYMIKATGTARSVSTDTSLGTMELEVDGYDGPITISVYIGSRIPSDESSVRDSVGFIQFGDFREQTEYGKVSAEINRRVVAMLGAIDLESLEGRPVALYGAMTIRTFNLVEIDVRQVEIVPVTLEVA